MATSGNFDTSNQYIKYRIVVTENSYSIPNNNSSVSVQVQVWRTNSGYTTYGSGTCYCTINGTEYSQSITSNQEFTYNSYTPVFNTTVTIPHDADGSKTIYVSSRISHDRFSSSSQGFNVTLTKIPRYATSNQTLANKTETTIKMNWSSDSTIDYIWYSSNNGSSWTGIDVTDGSSGSYTINNLSANTTYNIKTRVRRKDSQITTDSAALSVTTYDYPKCNSSPNFTIGNNLTLGIYNPLGRTCTVSIIGANNTTYGNSTVTGTSISGFNNTGWVNWWYSTLPNAKSGTYQVKVVYGSITKTTTGGTYTINENNCKPTITNTTYIDNNSTTTAITGNNQLIIRNNSNLLFTFGTLSANKSATLSKVEVTINGVTHNETLTGSSVANKQLNFGTVNVASNTTATIKLTDSRQVAATTTVNISVLDWVLPTAILTLQRQNNYYSTTYIKANASYSSLNGNNTITLQYQYKKTTDSSYSALATLTNNVQSQFEADNLYQWNVRVIVTDRLGSTTYNLFLDKGMPIIFFDRYKNSTGFNKFPTQNNSTESDNFVGDLDGTATNSTNSTNIAIVNTEPTSSYTTYATFVSATGGNLQPRVNNGFRYNTLQGTSSVVGQSNLILGNGTGSGTAGNKSGIITLYSENTGAVITKPVSNMTGTVTIYMPQHTGHLLTETILYENASGVDGNFTLSESIANFEYIEVFFRERIYRQGYMKFLPTGYLTDVPLSIMYHNGTAMYHRTVSYQFSGTSATKKSFLSYNIVPSTKVITNEPEGSNAYIKIYKVVGWK